MGVCGLAIGEDGAVSEEVEPGTSAARAADAAGEIARLREQVTWLSGENARLLRLLGLTAREARPPGSEQTAIFETPPGTAGRHRRGPP